MCVVVGVQRVLRTPAQSLYSFFCFCTDCMIELALNNVPVRYLFVHFSLLKLWADTFVQDSMVQGTTRETRLRLSF